MSVNGEGPLSEAELLAQEEAYLLKIQQNKDKKFASKVFGTNLQSARDGGQPATTLKGPSSQKITRPSTNTFGNQGARPEPVLTGGLEAARAGGLEAARAHVFNQSSGGIVSPRQDNNNNHSYSQTHYNQTTTTTHQPPVNTTTSTYSHTVEYKPVEHKPFVSNVDTSTQVQHDTIDSQEMARKEEERLAKMVGGGGPKREFKKDPAPVNVQPVHQPVHAQPVHQPVHQQPVYQPPVQQQPVYNTPTVTHSAIHQSQPQQQQQQHNTVDFGQSGIDERLKREEERIAKAEAKASGREYVPNNNHGVYESSTPLAGTGPRHKAEWEKVPSVAQYHTKYENFLLAELISARMSPKDLISQLQERRRWYQGNDYKNEVEGVHLQTREGVAAVDEAIEFLKNKSSLGAASRLIPEDGLGKSAMDFCIQQRGISMSETDDQANSRLNRYGEYVGKCLQNVAICNESPTDVVLGWIIDDGNKRRDHRNSIFDPVMQSIGIGSGPHTHGRVISAIFTEGFIPIDDPRHSSQRKAYFSHFYLYPLFVSANCHSVHTQPPTPTQPVQRGALPPDFRVGELKAINNNSASLLTISGLLCDVSGLSLTITGNGTKLDFSRTLNLHTDQRVLNLPYPVSPQTTTASYHPTVNGGELQITLGKIQVQSSADFEIAKFVVRGDPNSNVPRVAISINQSNKDYYEFVLGQPTQYDTTFTVNVKDTSLTFKSSCDVNEGAEIVTKETTQSVKLPTIPSRDQVEVVPTSNGSSIRVYHKPRAGANTNQQQLPDARVNITVV